MSFEDTVHPSKPMYLLGNFNAHVLGALSLSTSTCPCHGHPLHAAITGGTSCGRGRRMWALLQMRNLHVLNGCAHMQLQTCHTCTAHVQPTKSTVNYLVVNDAALPMVARAVIVDRPFQPTCKNYHLYLMLHLNRAPLQAGQPQTACTTVRWLPGSEQLWEQHTSMPGFADGLL